jgi:hypothetical protein
MADQQPSLDVDENLMSQEADIYKQLDLIKTREK